MKTKGDATILSIHVPVPQVAPHLLPIFVEPIPYDGPAYNARRDVNYIPDDESIANVFVLAPLPIKSVALCIMT